MRERIRVEVSGQKEPVIADVLHAFEFEMLGSDVTFRGYVVRMPSGDVNIVRQHALCFPAEECRDELEAEIEDCRKAIDRYAHAIALAEFCASVKR